MTKLSPPCLGRIRKGNEKGRDVFLHSVSPILRKASSQEGMEEPTIPPPYSPPWVLAPLSHGVDGPRNPRLKLIGSPSALALPTLRYFDPEAMAVALPLSTAMGSSRPQHRGAGDRQGKGSPHSFRELFCAKGETEALRWAGQVAAEIR